MSAANLADLVAAVLIVLAAVGVVLKMRKVHRRVAALQEHFDRREREGPKDKNRRKDLEQLKQELHTDIESLRSEIRNVNVKTDRLEARMSATSRPQVETSAPVQRTSSFPASDAYDEPRAGDRVAELVSLANRIVQQSSISLDVFRASTGAHGAQVSAWPSATESSPTAFIVEHRGSHYAVPNVVKPARLPQEWFNRSEFGVNDEIRSVVSLPRLRRRGNDYEVQDPGVFTR